MNLYIMTRGRANKQITLKHIPPSFYSKTYLVCPKSEVLEHEHMTFSVPTKIDNYSKKMQFLIDHIRNEDNGIGVIMDDDIWFDKRIVGQEKLRKPIDEHEVCDMFSEMEHLLQTTALVGVHPRQMGQNKELPFVCNGKIICVQGINTNLFPRNMPRVDKYPILSDVWLNCELLSRGIGNKLITTWVQDHASCQAPGGCSIYRTPEMQKECCEELERKFAPYFKVVKKTAKNNWLGGERYDFRCQWKRLFTDRPNADL